MIKVIPSIADIYWAIKDNENFMLDTKEKEIKTSTKITYNEKTSYAVIAHNSKNPERILVPCFNFSRINELTNFHENAEENLIFLQRLFNTDDSLEEITQNLEAISGIRKDEIRISTLYSYYRIPPLERQVSIQFTEETMLYLDASMPLWKPF